MQEGEDYLFSEEELTVLTNRDFLKTKQIVTQKIQKLLLETETQLKPFVKQMAVPLLENILVNAGKISRGEKYENLPYQVLDYPRHFSKESIFTYRTMFWWGNFFSCTLHIQGSILGSYRNMLQKNLPRLLNDHVFFCINDNPWQHHFHRDNYLPLEEISQKDLCDLINNKPFIKLSTKLPLEQNRALPAFSLKTLKLFEGILNDSSFRS
jgi:hypothetical protein